jgi:N-dimethylarginine dimethylaminohydrolase
MLFPYGRWLMCSPVFFDVKYEINPWMSVQRAPHSARAIEQWRTLHHTLIRLGAWVEYVEPDARCPDMVFTANAGLVLGKRVVLSSFRHAERQGEVPGFRSWFKGSGFETLELSSGTFEGEGDALFAGEKLFCGHGFRTAAGVFPEVAKLLGVKRTVECELIDPRFYHLDTCFCPLNPKQALIYPGAFSERSHAAMKSEIELFPVPESDAVKFACNAVVLGKQIVVPAGCTETGKTLASLGFTVFEVELSEFIKAGGAAKCLSLRL